MTSKLIWFTLSALVFTGVAGCKGGTECKSWAGGYGERSVVSWGECSDKSKREVQCELLGPGKYECKCIKDGVVGKSFDHTSGVLGDKAKSSSIANEACGWDLET